MNGPQFGDKLRRHRERQGLSLEAIAGTTKIGRSLLAALERGDCSRWPGGIYARAYLRAYAAAVGLDPEETVAQFCETYPQFARPEPVDPDPAAVAHASVRRSRLAQARDFLDGADRRLDLLFRIERSE